MCVRALSHNNDIDSLDLGCDGVGTTTLMGGGRTCLDSIGVGYYLDDVGGNSVDDDLRNFSAIDFLFSFFLRRRHQLSLTRYNLTYEPIYNKLLYFICINSQILMKYSCICEVNLITQLVTHFGLIVLDENKTF